MLQCSISPQCDLDDIFCVHFVRGSVDPLTLSSFPTTLKSINPYLTLTRTGEVIFMMLHPKCIFFKYSAKGFFTLRQFSNEFLNFTVVEKKSKKSHFNFKNCKIAKHFVRNVSKMYSDI